MLTYLFNCDFLLLYRHIVLELCPYFFTFFTHFLRVLRQLFVFVFRSHASCFPGIAIKYHCTNTHTHLHICSCCANKAVVAANCSLALFRPFCRRSIHLG